MLEWHWKPFAALAPAELYAMLAARSAVFVIEQQCLYSDLDGLDLAAWHLYAVPADQAGSPLAACARVLPPDAQDACVRIGRVLTMPGWRGQGLGKVLIEQALARIAEQWPGAAIRLHAQAHLQRFYGGHGFAPVSAIHLEDNIEHVWMQRG
jgi:ElaA protein